MITYFNPLSGLKFSYMFYHYKNSRMVNNVLVYLKNFSNFLILNSSTLNWSHNNLIKLFACFLFSHVSPLYVPHHLPQFEFPNKKEGRISKTKWTTENWSVFVVVFVKAEIENFAQRKLMSLWLFCEKFIKCRHNLKH